MSSSPWLAAACVTSMVLAACGGQTSGPGPGGSSSGSSGSSGGTGSSGGSGSSGGASSTSSSGGTASSGGLGCSNFSTVTSNVDPTLCAPQLESATSCDSQVCSFDVAVPCLGDAGISDLDAGTEQCTAWCNAAAPPDAASSFGFCQMETIDGGAAIVAHCGGCGI